VNTSDRRRSSTNNLHKQNKNKKKEDEPGQIAVVAERGKKKRNSLGNTIRREATRLISIYDSTTNKKKNNGQFLVRHASTYQLRKGERERDERSIIISSHGVTVTIAAWHIQ